MSQMLLDMMSYTASHASIPNPIAPHILPYASPVIGPIALCVVKESLASGGIIYSVTVSLHKSPTPGVPPLPPTLSPVWTWRRYLPLSLVLPWLLSQGLSLLDIGASHPSDETPPISSPPPLRPTYWSGSPLQLH